MVEADVAARIQRYAVSPNNHCFACGPANPHGLHLHFRTDGERTVAEFTPEPWHEGWEGVVHGGVISTLLDEAMAYTLFFRNLRAVTARMEVRFRRGARAGDRLGVEARIIKEARSLVDIEARVLRGELVMAEATGRFVKQGSLDAVLAATDAVDMGE